MAGQIGLGFYNMNKRILLSWFTIATALFSAVGVTWAYFSDREESRDNTFAAGTIDLAINGQNPFDRAIINVPDIKPGYKVEKVETLGNVGTLDGVASMQVVNAVSQEGADSEPECLSESALPGWDAAAGTCDRTQGSLDEDICRELDYHYCYDLDDNGQCDSYEPQGNFGPNQDIVLGLLEIGAARKLWLGFSLPESSGNEFQGDSCSFDIIFSLVQFHSAGKEDLKNEAGEVEGWFAYWESNSVTFEITTGGLTPSTCHQITLESQGNCTAVDTLLAAGEQGHTGTFDAGYWNGSGGLATQCAGGVGFGVYNPAYVMTDGSGHLFTVFTIGDTVTGSFGNWPALPNGAYENLRLVVKQIDSPGYGCPEPGEAPIWPGAEQYVGKLFSPSYNIHFSMREDDLETKTVYLQSRTEGVSNQYGYQYDYGQATASFTYDTPSPSRLSGTVAALDLKPYVTYQVKLIGRPTCIDPAGSNAASEAIGYRGRWTCLDCICSGAACNRTDAEYQANKARPDGDPNKECLAGYLVWDYITADGSGNVTKKVTADDSYHVLWCSGGTCGADNNNQLAVGIDPAHPLLPLCQSANVNGQLERFSCGGLSLPAQSYNLDLVLTEECFHQQTFGTWTNVMSGTLDFTIE